MKEGKGMTLSEQWKFATVCSDRIRLLFCLMPMHQLYWGKLCHSACPCRIWKASYQKLTQHGVNICYRLHPTFQVWPATPLVTVNASCLLIVHVTRLAYKNKTGPSYPMGLLGPGPGPQASGGPKQPMCYFSSREIIVTNCVIFHWLNKWHTGYTPN